MGLRERRRRREMRPLDKADMAAVNLNCLIGLMGLMAWLIGCETPKEVAEFSNAGFGVGFRT